MSYATNSRTAWWSSARAWLWWTTSTTHGYPHRALLDGTTALNTRMRLRRTALWDEVGANATCAMMVVDIPAAKKHDSGACTRVRMHPETRERLAPPD